MRLPSPQDSVEEQKYRSALQAEKSAFESLIYQKGQMARPSSWGGRDTLPPSLAASPPRSLPASASRRAGGRLSTPAPVQPPTVIVDMREFGSSLPNMLHLHGTALRPATLEGEPLLPGCPH